MDKRIIRTKRAIRSAFLDLRKEQPLEEIKVIDIKKDPRTGKEIISYNKENKNEGPKTQELISIKDPNTGKEKLINKNTGNELTNIEKK